MTTDTSEKALETLIDRLRALPTETEWLEFKRNHVEPQELGEYLSALANEAALCRQPQGRLVFGIDNATHEVLGASFDAYATKAKGNQDLLPWLGALLQPNPGVEVQVVQHPAGRVVLLSVGPARDRPVSFAGKAWCRAGTSKTELSRHPEKERALWSRGDDWSAELCPRAGLADLDPDAVTKAREQFLIKHPQQAQALSIWDDLTFLNKARVLRQGAVTNAAVLLLGRPEAATLLAPAVAKVSWIVKDAGNHELDYEHIGPPLLLAGERLLKRLRNLTVRALPSGTLFPQEMTQYDPWVLREALHNAVAHQDYRRQARIVVVESPDGVRVSNAGTFLPGRVETVIEQDAPQLLYRNPFLADAIGGVEPHRHPGRRHQAHIRDAAPPLIPNARLQAGHAGRGECQRSGADLGRALHAAADGAAAPDAGAGDPAGPGAEGAAHRACRAPAATTGWVAGRALPARHRRGGRGQGHWRSRPAHPRTRVQQAVLRRSDRGAGSGARPGRAARR
jgi:predicted HTH transcriptional regulator